MGLAEFLVVIPKKLKGCVIMKEVTASGWKNKGGTSNRSCSCGSWKSHWINCSGKPWPKTCSVSRCIFPAASGLHVINPDVSGEKIVPGCASCNQRNDEFALKNGVTLVSANKQDTCQK